MPEAETQGVEQGIAPPAEDNALQVQTQESQSENVETQQESFESKQDRNWKETRRTIDELRRDRESLAREIESLKNPKKEEFNIDSISDDDLLTKAQTLKAAEKIAANAVAQAMRQREYKESPKLIESECQDYESVVTAENIERLKQKSPRMAAALSKIEDPYAQGMLAYNQIKALGISKPGLDQMSKAKLEENSKKPASMNTMQGKNALTEAYSYSQGGELTQEMKQNYHKEMLEAIKGA